jgi:hypothetical protein
VKVSTYNDEFTQGSIPDEPAYPFPTPSLKRSFADSSKSMDNLSIFDMEDLLNIFKTGAGDADIPFPNPNADDMDCFESWEGAAGYFGSGELVEREKKRTR